MVVQRHVGHLVTVNPLQEVGHGLLLVTADVVGAAELHLLTEENITCSEKKETSGFCGFQKRWRCDDEPDTHTHSLTLIFSAMMSGSSQMDSTKKTCRGRAAARAEAAGVIVKGDVRHDVSG